MTPRASATQPDPSSPSPALEGLPSQQDRPTGVLAFRQPETDPDPETNPPADWPSPADAPSEDLAGPSDAPPRSSRTSSGVDSASLRKTIRDAARELVLGLGALAYDHLARDEAAKTVGLWATDDDDVEAIGDPLGSMASRRLGRLAGAGSPDAGDIFEAVVGILSYAMKQGNKWWQARAMRRIGARRDPAQGDAEPMSPAGEGDRPAVAVQPGYGPGTGSPVA